MAKNSTVKSAAKAEKSVDQKEDKEFANLSGKARNTKKNKQTLVSLIKELFDFSFFVYLG